MAQAHFVLTINLADPELLEMTSRSYVQAIERQEMTDEEACDNLAALALGMMELKLT